MAATAPWGHTWRERQQLSGASIFLAASDGWEITVPDAKGSNGSFGVIRCFQPKHKKKKQGFASTGVLAVILSLSFSRLTCERRALSLRQVFWWFVASPRHSGVFGEAPLCSAVLEICFGVYFQLLCTQISLKFEIKHEQHLVTFKTTQWTGRRLLIGTLTKSGSMWVTTGLITTSFTIYSTVKWRWTYKIHRLNSTAVEAKNHKIPDCCRITISYRFKWVIPRWSPQRNVQETQADRS